MTNGVLLACLSLFFAVVFAVAGAEVQASAPETKTVASDAASSAAVGLEVQVGSLDGSTVTGKLLKLSGDEVTIQSDGKDVTVSGQRLLSIIPQKTPELSAENPTAWIELVDGSKLTSKNFTVKKGMANIEVGGAGCQLPTSAIRSVRFSKPGDPSSLAWPAKVSAEATSDLLAVRKKDAVDFNEGVLESADEKHVIFQIDGESVPVARTKVDGLIFFHKAADTLPEPACIVDDINGWKLKAKQITLSGRTLYISTTGGQKFCIVLNDVTRLDFSAGKIIYLSDLEPASVHWTPYLEFHKASAAMEQFYAPRRDEGREHLPLLIGGKTYAKGLALYSRTTIEYRLPAGAKTFKATAGIDDSVREVGQVRLEISADGKKLFDKPISGAVGAVDVDLDVAGAKRLSILVDYGEGLDAGDYLNLADARIVK